jgi:hypothetical protein
MEKFNSDKYYGIISLGLTMGYTRKPIEIESVFTTLRQLQEELINAQQIYLSANCFESTLVLSGQKEPHLNIKFINYPRFPLAESVFKKAVVELAEKLAAEFEQHRIVIEFHDEFTMLQKDDSIDPSIRTN